MLHIMVSASFVLLSVLIATTEAQAQPAPEGIIVIDSYSRFQKMAYSHETSAACKNSPRGCVAEYISSQTYGTNQGYSSYSNTTYENLAECAQVTTYAPENVLYTDPSPFFGPAVTLSNGVIDSDCNGVRVRKSTSGSITTELGAISGATNRRVYREGEGSVDVHVSYEGTKPVLLVKAARTGLRVKARVRVAVSALPLAGLDTSELVAPTCTELTIGQTRAKKLRYLTSNDKDFDNYAKTSPVPNVVCEVAFNTKSGQKRDLTVSPRESGKYSLVLASFDEPKAGDFQ
jgi:hypothetical protein